MKRNIVKFTVKAYGKLCGLNRMKENLKQYCVQCTTAQISVHDLSLVCISKLETLYYIAISRVY
jgi:hypothetical protein